MSATARIVNASRNLPLANLVTLGAHDFVALRDFYRRVRWPQVIDDGGIAVFELRGTVFAVFPLAQLARDADTEPTPSTAGIHLTIGYKPTPREIQQLAERMRTTGARVTRVP